MVEALSSGGVDAPRGHDGSTAKRKLVRGKPRLGWVEGGGGGEERRKKKKKKERKRIFFCFFFFNLET